MRIIPCFLIALAACVPDTAVQTHTNLPYAQVQSVNAPLEVRVDLQCANALCDQLVAQAITETGVPTSWTWTWGSQVLQGSIVFLPVTDGVEVLHLSVLDVVGGSGENEVFVSMMPGEDTGGGVPSKNITFVPRGGCSNIPVVSIGGCFVGIDTLEFTSAGVLTNTVNFTPSDVDPDLSGSGYYGGTHDFPAIWRMASGAEGWAAGTDLAMYDALYLLPAPNRHFTFYFEGNVPDLLGSVAYSTVISSHLNDGVVFGPQYKIQIGCDGGGKVASLDRWVVGE